jgi:hypothetical protein
LGDVYNQYGPSPDQQAFRAVLDSLRYDGMDNRRDWLNSAERGTFEWALVERAMESMVDRDDAGEESGQEDEEDNEHYKKDGESYSDSDDGKKFTDGNGSGDEGVSTDNGEDQEEIWHKDDLWHKTKTIDANFTDWLMSEEEEGSLFCFMGKPGTGKSTLMYDSCQQNG